MTFERFRKIFAAGSTNAGVRRKGAAWLDEGGRRVLRRIAEEAAFGEAGVQRGERRFVAGLLGDVRGEREGEAGDVVLGMRAEDHADRRERIDDGGRVEMFDGAARADGERLQCSGVVAGRGERLAAKELRVNAIPLVGEVVRKRRVRLGDDRESGGVRVQCEQGAGARKQRTAGELAPQHGRLRRETIAAHGAKDEVCELLRALRLGARASRARWRSGGSDTSSSSAAASAAVAAAGPEERVRKLRSIAAWTCGRL